MTNTRNGSLGFALLLFGVFLTACHERAANGRKDNRGPPAPLTEEKIAAASKKLWEGSNPNEDWESVAKRLFEACGGVVGTNEAFRIVEHHPRTTHDWVWRGAFESALTKFGSPIWRPKNAPTCKLIRDALGETHTRVLSQN